MAHCLLARDRAAGAVTLLSPAAFDRSEDATEAARVLVVSGAVDPESTEILVVDLAAASRVEFITLPVPVDEPVSEDFGLAPAAGVWETPADVPEPAEVVGVPEPEPAPECEIAPEGEPEGAPEVDEAPLGEDMAAPEPEMELLSEPVLEPAPAPVAEEPAAAETPAGPEDERMPVDPVAITEVTIVESLPVVELDVGPYEVSGELILERYTCDDCVYANTCPKVGESAPAECGSFQWKAL